MCLQGAHLNGAMTSLLVGGRKKLIFAFSPPPFCKQGAKQSLAAATEQSGASVQEAAAVTSPDSRGPAVTHSDPRGPAVNHSAPGCTARELQPLCNPLASPLEPHFTPLQPHFTPCKPSSSPLQPACISLAPPLQPHFIPLALSTLH